MDLSTFLPTARVFSAEKVNCSKTDEKLEGGGGGISSQPNSLTILSWIP